MSNPAQHRKVLKPPSKLKEDQLSGKNLLDKYSKPQIIQFLNTNDYSSYPDSAVPIDELLFQPTPVLIQFTDYEPLQTKSQLLRLRNKDKVMRKVKVVPPDSNLFQIIPCKHTKAAVPKSPQDVDNMNTSVAPGMEVSYIVKFSPESKIDYSYDLSVLTEREKFIIPIRTVGCKSILEFPDVLDFGKVPVNHETLKPVIINNIGEKVTKWKFNLTEATCFSSQTTEGILEVGESAQLMFKFTPMDVRRYMERFILMYDMLEAEVQLKGESYRANVYLSKGSIKMRPTYVGLKYCEFVEIINDGNTAMEFSWLSSQTVKEEQEKREKKIKSLVTEETTMQLRMEDEQFEESEEGSLDSDDSYDDDELNKKREKQSKKKKDIVKRNFQSKKAEILQKQLYFNDENDTYRIEPETGKIWPKSKMTISVNFTPINATEVAMTAFCNISGCEERLKLELVGLGLGPKAKILPQTWSLNDISVNEKQSQVFRIYNQGQIPFQFRIKPANTSFGKLFSFDITEGYLETFPPNNEMSIGVEFSSSKVGDFSERFEIQLGKEINSLTFTCEGKVIAPPMRFEEQELDFQVIPFGFEEIREVTLVNQSTIEINFEVNVLDGTEKDIFSIEDTPNIVPPMGSVKIKVKFASQSEGNFLSSLTVKVPNVAQDFVTLPLKGICQRPIITMDPPDILNYGEVYLRKAKTKTLKLINKTGLNAKYKTIEQDYTSSTLGTYKVIPDEGEIPANSECEVTISLEAQMRGPINIPLHMRLTSNSSSERITLKADVLGPHITTDVQYKEFKDIKVLSKIKEKVIIHNDSEIPANFTIFTKEKNSIFKIEPKTGTLEPDETRELSIVCSPDDMRVFDDVLYVEVRDGAYCEVKLKARALGTSICIAGYESYYDDSMKLPVYCIDLGTQYANFEILKVLNVENRGRKKQRVRFERIKGPKETNKLKDQSITTLNASKVNESKKTKEEDESCVFSIDPIEEEKGARGLTLEPQHGFLMNGRGRSKAIQTDYIEGFKFFSKIDNTIKDDPIFILNFKGNFILPQLNFSEPKLHFKHIWQSEAKTEPIVKDLEITCQSEEESKGASFRLNLPLPFRIKEPIEKMALIPGEKMKIQVEFDPSGIEDRTSKTITNYLEFIYDRDKGGIGKPNYMLLLEGELSYPNLNVSPTQLDFGCVLLDTSKKEYLHMKNIKELPAKYHWEFFEEVVEVIQEEPEEEQKKDIKKSQPNIAISELFDIIPVNGTLQPGESELVEVTFKALMKTPRQAYAKCVVEGGPEYIVNFKGEGAELVSPVLDDILDFGSVGYCEEGRNSFKIKNSGKVAFKYFVSLEKVSRPEIFKIEKQSGIIAPDDLEKIDVRLKPGIPCEFQEKLLVYIAHLEPKEILVTAVGIFPFLIFAAHRADKEIFIQKAKEIETLMASSDKPNQCLNSIEDVQKILSKKQDSVNRSQINRSQISVVLRPQSAVAEAEIDRKELCNNILNKLKGGMRFKSHPGDKKAKVDIVAGKYTWSLGNLVTGPKKLSILFFNIGHLATNINAYTPNQKDNGVQMTVTSEKNKLSPLEGSVLNVTLDVVRKKGQPIFGHKVIPVFVEVKGGPRYEIDFEANITSPELSFSHETINFGDVPCGQRKTITVRFENLKEVMCEWIYTFKEDVASSGQGKKNLVPVFALNPNNGKLMPGEKVNVDITFAPNAKKDFSFKVQPTVKNSQLRHGIKVQGKGVIPSVKLDKSELLLNTSLPYVDAKEYVPIKIINESSAAIEAYSLEFDKVYLEEEKFLMDYPKLDTNKFVPKPARVPGTAFWKEIIDDVESKKRSEALALRLSEIEKQLQDTTLSEAKIEELKKEKEELEQAKLQEEAAAMAVSERTPKVDEDVKMNIVIFGWDKNANAAIANRLAEVHKRGIIKLPQLLQWNMQKNTQAAQDAQNYLVEREKLLKEEKKKKPKKGEVPKPDTEFMALPNEILIQLLKNRMMEEDCNSGIIFDSLEAENCKGIIDAVEVVSETCGISNIRVIMLKNGLKPDVKDLSMDAKDKKEDSKEETKEETKADIKEVSKEEEKKEDLKETIKLRTMTAEEEKAYLDEYTKLEQTMSELALKSLTSQNSEGGKKYGERLAIPIEIIDSDDIFNTVLSHVPEPQYPDPSKLPLPPPYTEQLLVKPKELHQAPVVIPQFRLLTLKEVEKKEGKVEEEIKDQKEQKKEEKKESKEEKKTSKEQKKEEKKIGKKEVKEEEKPPESPYEEKTRWIVPAKGSQEIFVKFYSETIGNYQQVLHFGVVGSEKVTEIDLKGNCEYPSMTDKPIDIYTIYEKKVIKPNAPPEKHYDKIKNYFDFGPLLIGKEFDKRQQEKCKVNVARFVFKNTGKFPLHADFVLRSQSKQYAITNKTAFYIEPSSIDIPYPSEESKEIKVWALPDKPIEYNDTLLCVLKDNPNPIPLNLHCFGSQPEAKIEPEGIFFERLLVNQEATRKLKITNEGRIPINWKLQGINKLPKEFVISSKEGTGVLKPSETTTISFTFMSKEQKEYNHDITLIITDDETKELKQEPKVLKVQARSYIISVAPRFDANKQGLEFGAVRVGEVAERSFFLKNNGLYEVKYRVLLKTKDYRDRFTVQPLEGTLNSAEEKTISVAFKSKDGWAQNANKDGTNLAIQIMEGNTGKKREEIPIKVNVKAVYSQFSITPVKGINFGPIQYGESKSMSFEIKNEGKFEFTYSIIDAKAEEVKSSVKEEVDVPSKSKKEEKKAVAKKKGKESENVGGLKIGQYIINPSTGNISPGSSAIVKVQFVAEGGQLYVTDLSIDITGRNYDDSPKGASYQLMGESCIPRINTEDVQSIFEEQIVVNTLDPNAILDNARNKSMFSIEENVFWFGTLVPVKDTQGQLEKFKITNSNKIPCSVKLSVKPRTSSKSEGFAFELTPDTLKISPHESQYVKVLFKPTNIMSYGGVFEALVDNGDPKQKGGRLSFELRGEGVLPTVSMEKPNTIGADGVPVLMFKKTRSGNSQRSNIVLKNEGVVTAMVRIDPVVSDVFSLTSSDSVTVQPKAYQNFEFVFEPKTIGEFKQVVNFVTVNNPYEVQKVCLYAESYQEDVVFENLPEDAEDELKIGDCVVNKTKKVQFDMSSKTNKYLRFEWIHAKEEIKCYPRIGFLKPHATKNMVFVFKGSSSVKIEDYPVLCRFTEIDTEGQEIPDWDDTIMEVRMVRPSELKLLILEKQKEDARLLVENETIYNQIMAQKTQASSKGKLQKKEAKKETKKDIKTIQKDVETINIRIDETEEATEEIQEPTKQPIVKLIESSLKEVELKCSATADYSKYECSIDSIHFKPTLMFQTRSYKFAIKNTSLIAFEYNCKLTNNDDGSIDSGPYTILPRKGVIQAGCEESFIIKFSPIDAEDSFERLLVISIPSLDPNQKPLVIEVDGSSERPVCHFELPHSKYREKKEKDMAPIDNKYNIIEFESLGTKVKNIKRFMVVNPTGQGYDFEWIQNEDENKSNPANIFFRCLTPKGTILSGKKFEMAFEYVPDTVGTHESYWEFRVPSDKINQAFLVVGQVLEPLVRFEIAKVDFGPLLVGGKNRETVQLFNQEHIPFFFQFDSKSLQGSEDGDSLKVTPMNGTVNPQSSVPIEITFIPNTEKSFNFNLSCKVKRKGRPLNLNVKGVGYVLKHEVYTDTAKFPIQPKETNELEFGDFFINEKKSRTITIVNLGEFNFDFVWKRKANSYFTIIPESGNVKKGSKTTVELTYFPITPHKLSNYRCTLSIISGPSYEFQMIGSARKPGVEFDFQRFDFGKCFVMRQPLSKVKNLVMKNNETTALSVDLLFSKKPYLDVQFNPGQVLLPCTNENNEKITVPIIFTPRDTIKYEETITFDFNAIYKVSVVIAGEGIPLILELTRPEDQFLDFGVIKVGGDQTRSVSLINKSKKAVTFKVFPDSVEEFQKCCLNLSTNNDTEYTLKSNETFPIEIRFQPTMRMPMFKHELLLQVKDNETRRLCSISGVSHGIEVKFMEDTVDFGPVVKGSRLTKQIKMANYGDVDAKFSWDKKSIPKIFTIVPETGRIPPHEDCCFEITFHPETVNDEIMRYEKIPCKIEGADFSYLNFTGKCVDQAKENTKDLYFTTLVRTPKASAITINNPTTSPWIIKPTISTKVDSCNEYFKGKPVLEIPAKGNGTYDVTYLPLSMTKMDNSVSPSKPIYHEALLFFPLPDGTALLYKLFGQSNPPESLSTIKESAIAKEQKFVAVPVKNWLNTVQRFTVSWKLPENSDPAIFIRGATTFDVASGSSKDYKLNFLAYKEGSCAFTLTFTNDSTGEYVFYQIQMAINSPVTFPELELTSVVRESTMRVITIENPLNTPVTISKSQFTVDNSNVFITPDAVTISPQREGAIEVNFRPLVVENKEATLKLINPQLGTFTYKLLLKGLKSTMQRSMHFKASLGLELVQAFRFTHYVKTPTTYTAKIQRISDGATKEGPPTEFKTEQPTIPAQAAETNNGTELSLNIKFEPNNIGETRAILIITNPEGVEYTCLLYGHGVAPQPQPITKIQTGKTSPIDFKNPLSEKLEFTIRFDNPCFSLANKLPGPIDPGKSVQLQIKFDYNATQSSTGRMIISTKGFPAWVYYLHGEKS